MTANKAREVKEQEMGQVTNQVLMWWGVVGMSV